MQNGKRKVTRDEAIAICFAILEPHFPHAPRDRLWDVAEMEVDMFSSLGMLKLKEEKDAENAD